MNPHIHLPPCPRLIGVWSGLSVSGLQFAEKVSPGTSAVSGPTTRCPRGTRLLVGDLALTRLPGSPGLWVRCDLHGERLAVPVPGGGERASPACVAPGRRAVLGRYAGHGVGSCERRSRRHGERHAVPGL